MIYMYVLLYLTKFTDAVVTGGLPLWSLGYTAKYMTILHSALGQSKHFISNNLYGLGNVYNSFNEII